MRPLLALCLALGLAACGHWQDRGRPDRDDPYPTSAQGQARAREAEREAERRCPTREVVRRPRAPGTAASDYDCKRPKS